MRTVPTRTFYLEMLAPPCTIAAEKLDVRRLHAPTVDGYRRLYSAVGSEYHWIDRLLMPDDELSAILADERVEVHVLYVAGEEAGYVELDRRTPAEVELAYFGLLPAFVGRGLGKRFLAWAVAKAWSHGPRRVWVHTCDLDHPAALPAYRQAGFKQYDEQVIQQVIAD